jgi:hypothetical protein
MEKHIDEARDSLFSPKPEPRLATSYRETVINLVSSAALWVCGGDNGFLRSYQDVSFNTNDGINVANDEPVCGTSDTTVLQSCHCRQHCVLYSRIHIGMYVCLLSSSEPRRIRL